MSDLTSKPKPRVVIELGDNGQMILEVYSNGQRSRIGLNRGTEYWEITDELSRQKRDIEASAKRKQESNEAKTKSRHNQVWRNTASDHGIAFAARVIKGEVPPSYGKYLLPEGQSKPKATSSPKAKAPQELTNINDLI